MVWFQTAIQFRTDAGTTSGCSCCTNAPIDASNALDA
jgi:hypothetical protein